MTITIALPPDLEQKLRERAAADGVAAETIVLGVLTDRLGRRQLGAAIDTPLSPDESRLLAEINRGLPEETWQRYRALVASRQRGSLSPAEEQELIDLTDVIELAHAGRMASLAELAGIRGIALDTLLDQFGIPKRAHE